MWYGGRRIRNARGETWTSLTTSTPYPITTTHTRLAAYREECEEGCQQAVKALEKELKALDLAVAQQEEAVEREMAGEAAEVDEALASLREEKAAVMLKLKELEA